MKILIVEDMVFNTYTKLDSKILCACMDSVTPIQAAKHNPVLWVPARAQGRRSAARGLAPGPGTHARSTAGDRR